MLRAALIGFASSGKTTLFQLMTSVRETGRAAHGKGETSVGISKVHSASELEPAVTLARHRRRGLVPRSPGRGEGESTTEPTETGRPIERLCNPHGSERG